MKLLFTLLLTIAIFVNVKGDFSINPLLDYLQESGYYQILAQIKYHIGEDIAIDVCKDLVKSIHCEEIIRIYIPPGPSKINSKKDKKPLSDGEKLLNIIMENYDVLVNEKGKDAVEEYINKIKIQYLAPKEED